MCTFFFQLVFSYAYFRIGLSKMEARRLSRLTVKLFPPSDIARTIELFFKMSESLKAACITYTTFVIKCYSLRIPGPT